MTVVIVKIGIVTAVFEMVEFVVIDKTGIVTAVFVFLQETVVAEAL